MSATTNIPFPHLARSVIIVAALAIGGCSPQRVAPAPSAPPAPATQTTGLYNPTTNPAAIDMTPPPLVPSSHDLGIVVDQPSPDPGHPTQCPVFQDIRGATSVAFVCDASGSMMEKMEALKRDLRSAIIALRPYQKFSVTFFQNESPIFVGKKLILATPENKRLAEHFLADVSATGSTDPIPGLDIAFHQHPQVLYLLTDGDFPDNHAVLREIHKLDPAHKVKINTIAFTDSADHDVDFRKLLKQIADESGGTFKSVNEEDLK